MFVLQDGFHSTFIVMAFNQALLGQTEFLPHTKKFQKVRMEIKNQHVKFIISDTLEDFVEVCSSSYTYSKQIVGKNDEMKRF